MHKRTGRKDTVSIFVSRLFEVLQANELQLEKKNGHLTDRLNLTPSKRYLKL